MHYLNEIHISTNSALAYILISIHCFYLVLSDSVTFFGYSASASSILSIFMLVLCVSPPKSCVLEGDNKLTECDAVNGVRLLTAENLEGEQIRFIYFKIIAHWRKLFVTMSRKPRRACLQCWGRTTRDCSPDVRAPLHTGTRCGPPLGRGTWKCNGML